MRSLVLFTTPAGVCRYKLRWLSPACCLRSKCLPEKTKSTHCKSKSHIVAVQFSGIWSHIRGEHQHGEPPHMNVSTVVEAKTTRELMSRIEKLGGVNPKKTQPESLLIFFQMNCINQWGETTVYPPLYLPSHPCINHSTGAKCNRVQHRRER